MENDEDLVSVFVPCYDEEGEEIDVEFLVPPALADYIEDLRGALGEERIVSAYMMESQQTTKILNQILISSSNQLKN